jgi:hypothetical protein
MVKQRKTRKKEKAEDVLVVTHRGMLEDVFINGNAVRYREHDTHFDGDKIPKKPKEKTYKFLALMFIIPLLALLIWDAVIVTDHIKDIYTCREEFSSAIAQTGIPSYKIESFYANEDWWIINNGLNIRCSVFWMEGNWLTSVEFTNGSLTPQDILKERYWT